MPLPAIVPSCFTGTTIGDLKKVFAPSTAVQAAAGTALNLVPQAGDEAVISSTTAASGTAAGASSCFNKSYSLGAFKTEFAKAIAAMGAELDGKAPLDTAAGSALLGSFLSSQLKGNIAALAADVQVTLSTSSDGRAVLSEEFDPAQQSDACSFRDLPADLSSWNAGATSTLMVRAKLSPKLVGVMANPFWLARHPTNQKNRGLHRARVVMYSYLCKEVSPAAAELAGGPAIEVPELVKYFPAGDVHAKASQSCYNCHATLQPLANFFSLLDKGDSPANSSFQGMKFFQANGAVELPGGYWTFSEPGKGVFYGQTGSQFEVNGLQGLANIFSDKKFPAPAQCVVSTAWSTLFGNEYKIPDEFKSEVLTAFNKGNSQGAASLTEAFRYILKSPYGRAYFSPNQGIPAFETLLKGGQQLTCDAANAAANQGIIDKNCSSCHNSANQSGGIAFFSSPEKTPLELSEQDRKLAYCALKNDEMPQDGPLSAADKARALCYVKPLGDLPNCGGLEAAVIGPDAPMHSLPSASMDAAPVVPDASSVPAPITNPDAPLDAAPVTLPNL